MVNQTRVLKQACFCLWKYPPKSVEKLCEVLGQKRYHIGGAWQINRFSSGLVKSSPFYRDFCTSAISCIQDALIMFISSTWSQQIFKFDKSPFQRVSCLEPWKAPLQNLLTRVCKSQLRAMWRRAPFPARALDFTTSKLIHVCWYHLLVEFNRQLWCIWSKPQVPLELLLGWKLRKLTILRPFWPLDDVTLGYCLQKKRKSNKTHSFHLFMMIYWNLVHSSSRAPWRLYHVPFCLGGDQCDAQSTQIYLCAENWWAVLLPKQKCQQVNIIGPLNYPLYGLL